MSRSRNPGRIQQQRQKQGPPPQRGKEPLQSRASGRHEAQGPRPPRAARKPSERKATVTTTRTSQSTPEASKRPSTGTLVFLVGVFVMVVAAVVVAAILLDSNAEPLGDAAAAVGALPCA